MVVIQIYLIGILLANLGGFTFYDGELLRLNIEEIGVVSPCRLRHRKRLTIFEQRSKFPPIL